MQGKGARSQCQAGGRGCEQGVRPSTGPGGGGDDSHLQKPRGAVAAAAAAVGGMPAAAPAVSRLLSVSVRVGSVDMEETSVEEDVEAWCWWCCWGLLLTVAPVL